MQRQKSYESQGDQVGKLYLVPTPIGNMEDMTYRAVTILKHVDLILAEDTRHTQKLTTYFDIATPLQSFHQHSNPALVTELVDRLKRGQQMGLVSDAGMPLINDPGHPLVQACLQAQIPVIALPGPNAALTALIASGLDTQTFTYYGFFPRAKKDQAQVLEEIGRGRHTAIFYESPYRIERSLASIGEILGDQVQVVIAREISKKYEEYLRGQVGDLIKELEKAPIKGEIVLMVAGGSLQADIQAQDRLAYKDHVQLLMSQQGLTAKAAIKEVAKIHQVKKQIVYNDYHGIVE